jgi:FkbM family methyltransferase
MRSISEFERPARGDAAGMMGTFARPILVANVAAVPATRRRNILKAALKRVYRRTPFKRVLFTALRPLHMPRALTLRLRFAGVVTVPIEQTSIRLVNDHYFVESDLFWSGFGNGWEGTSLKLWTHLAASSSFVLDIGANTGIYALAAKAVNPAATVVAFEPLQMVYRTLARNVSINGLLIGTEDLAVSDRDGAAELFEDRRDHTVATMERGNAPAVSRAVHTVVTTRLDSYLDARGSETPDLIKIDVEGHEPAVVRGMGRYLAQMPTLVTEILSDEVAAQVEALVLPLGYRFLQVRELEGLIEVTHLQVGDPGSRNFVLCAPATADTLLKTFPLPPTRAQP